MEKKTTPKFQTPKQTMGRNNIQVSSLKPSLMQVIVRGVGFS